MVKKFGKNNLFTFLFHSINTFLDGNSKTPSNKKKGAFIAPLKWSQFKSAFAFLQLPDLH